MVYRAVHVSTEMEFAVKTIAIAKDSKASDEILKEIESLKVCRHQNGVSLYGSMHHQDSLWVRSNPSSFRRRADGNGCRSLWTIVL